MRSYQVRAINHLLQQERAALWMDMGLGKTATVLTALRVLYDRLQASRTLVVAPLRVCQSVWRQEAAQWAHTQGFRFSLIHGTPEQRQRAAMRPADIYLTNYENLRWYCGMVEHLYLRHGRYPPIDTLVFDELSKLKNATSGRTKAVCRILPFVLRRWGLTGTPAPNGLKDLHGQYLVLDMGARLGVTKQEFRERFMERDDSQNNDWSSFPRWRMSRTSEHRVRQLVGDITVEMSASEYLELPPLLVNDIAVDLDPATRAKYNEMESKFFIELAGETRLIANAGVMTSACRQVTNGAMYPRPGERVWVHIHDAKLEALDDVIEEAAGRPVLVVVAFAHDYERILHRYGDRAELLNSRSPPDTEERWNAGKIPVLVGHPASMGHGLNLQHSSCTDVVYFGLDWNLEYYRQAMDRIAGGLRRNKPITVHRILARDTLDEVAAATLAAKEATEQGLRRAIWDYQQKRAA